MKTEFNCRTKNKRAFLVKEVFPAAGCDNDLKGFYEAIIEIIYSAWQREKKTKGEGL
jgi:hypothetical protein